MLTEIQQLLEGAGARRLSPDVPVYELAVPWWPFSRRARGFARARVRLLDCAFGLPGPTYLVVDENPQHYDVGGPWARAAARTWLVPASCSPAALLRELLEPGDWCLYACSRPLDASAIPDAFSVAPQQLAQFAFAHAIPFLAQAFHDNDPWRIFAESVDRAQAAAA